MIEAETKIAFAELSSPIGRLIVAWRGAALVAIEMGRAVEPGSRESRDVPARVAQLRQSLERRWGALRLERAVSLPPPARALVRYFTGDLAALDEIDVDPGGTPFQSTIWRLLRSIPVGRTMTYGELAARAARAGAARAAGRAVGTNPIPVVIPCHRIVGSDGRLTGFGGGLPRKEWLLAHEGARARWV